jgi:hypothetical protein
VDGHIDQSKVPDFISTFGRNGKVVGYVPKAYLFPSVSATPSVGESPVGGVDPVYASDLRTLVGHIYPGVGYVPLGTDPSSEPCVAESTYSGSGSQAIACPSTAETVPDLIGVFTPTAAGKLSGMSLSVQVVNVRSSAVPAGHIVAMSPSPGTTIQARSVVTIDNSLGDRAGS